MATPSTSCADLTTRFYDLQRVIDANTPNYGAQLQDLCERYWAALEAEPVSASVHVDAFAALLLQKDFHMQLAKLVIPDLRDLHLKCANPTKQTVLDKLRRAVPTEPRVLEEYLEARRLYEEELNIIREVDMYRAGQLLYNRGNLSVQEQERVRAWLKQVPKEGGA